MSQVVGYCSTDFGGGEPFIWQNGIITNLNDLIPKELNLTLKIAYAINNSGQIAVHARRPGPNGTDFVAVRLTPIPSSIGDFDGNCSINVDDLLGVINHWGDCPAPPVKGEGGEGGGQRGGTPCLADFNADGSVGVDDLLTVIFNWG